MAFSTPLWQQDAAGYSASDDRTLQGALFAPGVLKSDQLVVTQHSGVTNMSVDVAVGSVWVQQGSSDAPRRGWLCTSTAVENLLISTAPATVGQSRYDLIVAQVRDNTVDSGGINDWYLRVVQGTASASPVEPAVPTNSYVIARITVANGTTAIINAMITDRRTFNISRFLEGNAVATSGATDALTYNPANRRLELNNEAAQDAAFAGLTTSTSGINALRYDDADNRPELFLSADGGNTAAAGTDGGLYVGANAVPSTLIIPNRYCSTSSTPSFAFPTGYESPAEGSNVTYNMYASTGTPRYLAKFAAFGVQKSARLDTLSVYSIGSTNATTYYFALFTADTTDGRLKPGAKVQDLGSITASASGTTYTLTIASPPNLSPNTLYYVAWWTTTTYSSGSHFGLWAFVNKNPYMSQILSGELSSWNTLSAGGSPAPAGTFGWYSTTAFTTSTAPTSIVVARSFSSYSDPVGSSGLTSIGQTFVPAMTFGTTTL